MGKEKGENVFVSEVLIDLARLAVRFYKDDIPHSVGYWMAR